MTSHTDNRRDSGFTLLEITVVLVIAGLLLGVVVERGPFHSSVVTFGAARSKVVHILRSAQDRALTGGRSVTVIVDIAQRDFMTVAGKSVRHDRLTGPVSAFMPLPGGGMAPRGIFRFDPDGSASGPPLALLLGNETELLTVSPVTGRILAHVQ
ncbi:prepilin-type N-terminal cleavage/methylation domain-containing protein [Acetobacter conturbans]|uniref:Prepilin-type N-terminal cleavage/methylation domain-containing protein n=1 Tax=Acetobacter conturbans TaxID=1737472 RepID=A0ABX0JXV4_9PROT|nr:prepilin-type N-terminal cleavage/methylation domain-containing protein [Acetobacter conturbans]NHN87702.1 prepilin-type N-terminal cleavage/methylation domain-containing protein [Acetobacter conturbans]